MQVIDAKEWDMTIQKALGDIASSGGGIVQLGNKDEVVVISRTLWNALKRRMPSMADVLDEIRRQE